MRKPTPAMKSALELLEIYAVVEDYGDDKFCMAGMESRYWIGPYAILARTIEGLKSRGLVKAGQIEIHESWEE